MAFILVPRFFEDKVCNFSISSPVHGVKNNSPFDPIRIIKISEKIEIPKMPFERPQGYINTFVCFIIFGENNKQWIGFNIIAKKESIVSGIKEYIEGPYLVLNESFPSEPEIELAKKKGSFIIKEIDYYEKIQNHDKAFVILYRADVTETEILMLHYFENERYRERYGFPGGHIDPGETAVASAVREAREEAGIAIDPEDLKLAHFLDISKGTNDNRKYFYFATPFYEEFTQSPEPERYSVVWRDIYNLPSETPPHIKQVVKCILEEKYYSVFGYNT